MADKRGMSAQSHILRLVVWSTGVGEVSLGFNGVKCCSFSWVLAADVAKWISPVTFSVDSVVLVLDATGFSTYAVCVVAGSGAVAVVFDVVAVVLDVVAVVICSRGVSLFFVWGRKSLNGLSPRMWHLSFLSPTATSNCIS